MQALRGHQSTVVGGTGIVEGGSRTCCHRVVVVLEECRILSEGAKEASIKMSKGGLGGQAKCSRVKSTWAAPGGAVHETVKLKLMLGWGHQELREASRAAAEESCRLQRKPGTQGDRGTATSKAKGIGLPKAFGKHALLPSVLNDCKSL